METLFRIIVILMLLAIFVAVFRVGLLVERTHGIAILLNKRTKNMKELVTQLLATAAAQTTVIEGFIAFHVRSLAELQNRADQGDLDGVKEGIAVLQANTGKLAAAMVSNTNADDEVHADDGGTGDESTAVDVPAAVEAAGGDPSVLVDSGAASGEGAGGGGSGSGSSAGSEAAAGSGDGSSGGSTATGTGSESGEQGAAAAGDGSGEGDGEGSAAGEGAGSESGAQG